MKRNCFFHAGCPDGFGAAWALWRAWGDDGRFIPHSHDDPLIPLDFEGEQVVMSPSSHPSLYSPDGQGLQAEYLMMNPYYSRQGINNARAQIFLEFLNLPGVGAQLLSDRR